MKRALICVLIGLVCPALAGADPHGLRVTPFVFDPEGTGGVASDWLPFSDHGDEALVMSKMLPTAANAAAGAIVEGVDGIRLDELGFDVYLGGHCGGGAPRFDVTTEDGTTYFFGCFSGTHQPAPDKPATFERVRFRDVDAAPQFVGDPPWPGFGRACIRSITIVFDEGIDVGVGFTALDNIDIDGTLIGREGHGHGQGHGHGHGHDCDRD